MTAGDRAESFFAALQGASERALAGRGGGIERRFELAGHTVAMRFATPSLMSTLTPAFDHRAAEGGRPDLSIWIWDGSCDVDLPAPPWGADDHRARGDVAGYSDGPIRAAFARAGEMLSVLDLRHDLAIVWVRAADRLPDWERACPMRAIIHWWFAERGIQLVHAAAVGTHSRGVLLAGNGGVGKSTTALACMSAGLSFVGEDYCLLAAHPAPWVYSLYNSAKADARTRAMLPHLDPLVSNTDRLASEKAVLFLHPTHSHSLLAGLPLRALLVPRITERPETTLSRASTTAGLKALAPSSVLQLPGAGEQAFRLIADAVRQLDCHYLNLGSDLGQIPGVVTALLSD